MLFSINAWFDRSDPFISVRNRETGDEVARFNQRELENHVQKGDLCLEDFCSADARQQQLLVKDLLLLRCCYVMQTGAETLVAPQKVSNILPFPGRAPLQRRNSNQGWPIDGYCDTSY